MLTSSMTRHCCSKSGAQHTVRSVSINITISPRCQRIAQSTYTVRCSSNSTVVSTHPSTGNNAAPPTPSPTVPPTDSEITPSTAAHPNSTETQPTPLPSIPRPVPDARTELATAQLTELGCNPKQISKILSTLATKELAFDILEARQWLQLLSDNNIRDPLPVLVNHPLLLQTKARDLRENAKDVGSWIFSMGLTYQEIVLTLSAYPTLLCTPHTANTKVVSQWLIRELGWDGRQIVKALAKFPELFTYSTADRLSPTLAWFKSNGFSVGTVSKALLESPELFGSSTEQNESKLAALQAIGLSQAQVTAMVLREPDLLSMSGLMGEVLRLKVRFFVEVMGRKVEELVTCPALLLRSLKGCIGPRWAFSTRYESHEAFQLGARLRGSDKQFAEAGRSKALDAVCKARKVTRTQLYAKFKLNWQRVDGKEWCGGVVTEGGGVVAELEQGGESSTDDLSSGPQQ